MISKDKEFDIYKVELNRKISAFKLQRLEEFLKL